MPKTERSGVRGGERDHRARPHDSIHDRDPRRPVRLAGRRCDRSRDLDPFGSHRRAPRRYPRIGGGSESKAKAEADADGGPHIEAHAAPDGGTHAGPNPYPDANLHACPNPQADACPYPQGDPHADPDGQADGQANPQADAAPIASADTDTIG